MIDLGIASRHAVRVLGADGQLVCRASCVPSVESLTVVERAALAELTALGLHDVEDRLRVDVVAVGHCASCFRPG